MPCQLVARVKFSKLIMETGDWFTQVYNNILLFDRQEYPFVPTGVPQSSARSGVKDAARECGGTGAAGATRYGDSLPILPSGSIHLCERVERSSKLSP